MCNKTGQMVVNKIASEVQKIKKSNDANDVGKWSFGSLKSPHHVYTLIYTVYTLQINEK